MNKMIERKVNYSGSEDERKVLADAHSILTYGIYIGPEDLTLDFLLTNDGIEVRPAEGEIKNVYAYRSEEADLKKSESYVQVSLKNYGRGFTIFYHPKEKE